MLYILMLFLSASTFLNAAQQSKSKIKFDLSKLHSNYRHFACQNLSPEEYQDVCRKSKISFLVDALANDDVAKIQDLIRDGVDVNAIVDVDEGLRIGCFTTTSTALHVVAQWGYVRAARELLKSHTINIDSVGVFRNINSYQSMTPLLLAISQAEVVVTQATKKDWFHLDAAEEYEKIVDILIQHGAIVTTVKCDDTSTEDALLFAIKHGTPRMVKMLLDAGANIHATYDGYSVLRNALDRQNHEILKLLLDYGVNVDEKIATFTFASILPIDYLIFEYYTQNKKTMPSMIEELLFRGATILAPDVHSFKIALKERGGFTSQEIQQTFENLNKRNKDFAIQAEKIIAPEFLLLDLAKIVSEYIAAPIGKS